MGYASILPPKETFFNRFSISTIVFRGYEPVCEKSLSKIARAGFRGIELLESPDQFDMTNLSSIQEINNVCRDCRLSIFAFHAHYLSFDDVTTNTELQRKLEICYRQLDALEACGGNFWACHVHDTDIIALRAFEALAHFIETRPLQIGIENFTRPGMWVEDRLAFLEKLDAPNVGLLLDIGHVRNSLGQNPMTLKNQAGPVILSTRSRLLHVHLHGFVDGVDHCPPLCQQDEIQWPEILDALSEIGYSGLYNFEPKGKPLHEGSIKQTGNFYQNLHNQ
jgi:sugar phosphate isomerase/epimerase